jgi:hypothetical protein
MKKIKFLPVLAIILATASAFTFGKKNPQYYTLDGSSFVEITTDGDCIPGDFNCKYEANVSNPRLEGHPEDFDEVGDPLSVWSPK